MILFKGSPNLNTITDPYVTPYPKPLWPDMSWNLESLGGKRPCRAHIGIMLHCQLGREQLKPNTEFLHKRKHKLTITGINDSNKPAHKYLKGGFGFAIIRVRKNILIFRAVWVSELQRRGGGSALFISSGHTYEMQLHREGSGKIKIRQMMTEEGW